MKKMAFVLSITISTVSCVQKYPFHLGKGYLLDYDRNGSLDIRDTINQIFVEGQVVKFNYDSMLILAEQKPKDIILKQGLEEGLHRFKQQQKKFDTSSLRQYWIIDKRRSPEFNASIMKCSSLFGPFSEEEYLEKREELGVPRELELVDTEKLVDEIADMKQ